MARHWSCWRAEGNHSVSIWSRLSPQWWRTLGHGACSFICASIYIPSHISSFPFLYRLSTLQKRQAIRTTDTHLPMTPPGDTASCYAKRSPAKWYTFGIRTRQGKSTQTDPTTRMERDKTAKLTEFFRRKSRSRYRGRSRKTNRARVCLFPRSSRTDRRRTVCRGSRDHLRQRFLCSTRITRSTLCIWSATTRAIHE